MAKPTQQELAGMAVQFLGRAQLTGQEVPTFSLIVNWLETLAAEEPAPPTEI